MILVREPRPKFKKHGGKYHVFNEHGCRDLRRFLSGARFDVQDDFDVRFTVARPNPRQISEKQNFRSEIFAEFFFVASKNKTSEIVSKLFETRFAEVSRQSEPSLTGKRPFKVSKSPWP